jgi:3'-phosphoadenosine 5'-phosphosulfate sulfotransferase (PAPS reductase)/FAD synthetase
MYLARILSLFCKKQNMNNQKPYIVKFSGGRSSAMMLMKLLKNNQLNPKRGDVIIFNNTSAEHSATYEFTRQMKKIAEEKYNIPFFWIEYQTYEDSSGTYQWSRKPSYKLVNDQPLSQDNPSGYRYKGEVFEEMISLGGFLPSMVSRVCTISMKIFITNAFLSDWFAQKQSIERLGHYGSTPKMSDDDVIKTHKKNGGSVPKDILLHKKAFVRNCTFVREKQSWQDWTKVNIVINNEYLTGSVVGNKAQLYGDLAVDYISVLGMRSDEKRRIIKIENRIDESQENQGKSLFNQPHGENIYAPLVDDNITQEQVIEFWERQNFNLELPNTGLFSNCLYCPLKSKAKLQQVATLQLEQNIDKDTPESIDWWINIEKKYSRDLIAEKRPITLKNTKYVGFFGGISKFVFEDIKKKVDSGEEIDPELLKLDSAIPCNCTD